MDTKGSKRHERDLVEPLPRKKPRRSKKSMEVWQSFRQAQRRCGCSTAVLKELAKVVETLLTNNGSDSSEEEEEVVTNASADVEMFRADNVVVLQLHGCVGCHGYVFLPRDVRLR